MTFYSKLACLLIFVLLSGFINPAYAENQNADMTGRLGIGANITLAGSMGISGKYWLTDLIAAEAVFNYTTLEQGDSETTYFALGGRAMYTIFDYGIVHACLGTGISFGTTENNYENDFTNSTIDDDFFGVEFFFLVENMINDFFAISGQTGISYINGDENSSLSIGSPSVLGMFGFHFYI